MTAISSLANYVGAAAATLCMPTRVTTAGALLQLFQQQAFFGQHYHSSHSVSRACTLSSKHAGKGSGPGARAAAGAGARRWWWVCCSAAVVSAVGMVHSK